MNQMKRTLTLLLFVFALGKSLAQNATYGGPVMYNDKIIPQGNGLAIASQTGGALEVVKVTNNNTLSYKKQYPTGLTNFQIHWRGLSEAGGGFVIADIGRDPATNIWNLVVVKASNKGGTQIWMRKHPVTANSQVGEIIQAADGGLLVTGGNGAGMMFAMKLNSVGDLIWNNAYTSGFGWAAMNYPGGGYAIAGSSLHLWRLDNAGNLMYDQDIFVEDDPGGGQYTYSERERILNLQTGGFAVCGSAFSNVYSTTYYAKFDWNTGQTFNNTYQPVNTSLANTPVNWVVGFQLNTQSQIMLTYDLLNLGGPAVGTIRYQKIDLNGNPQGAAGNIGNGTPFWPGDFTNATGKFVFGGLVFPSNLYYVFQRAPITGPEGTDEPTPTGPSWVPPGYKVVWQHPDGSPCERFFMMSEMARPKLVKITDDPFGGGSAADLSPNPASDHVTVGGDFPQGGSVKIFSLDGRLALDRVVEPEESDLRLDIARLEKGLWLVRVQRGTEVASEKLVVN